MKQQGSHPAAEDLSPSDSALIQALSAAPVGLALVRGGRILWHNLYLAQMLGRGPGGLKGLVLADLCLVPRQAQRMGQALAEVEREGHSTSLLTRWRTSGGGEQECRLLISPFDLPQGPAAVVAVEDVSDRLATLRALRDSEEKYRQLTDLALMGVYIHQNGRRIYVNRRMAEILGTTVEDLLGREPWSHVHPDDREVVRQRGLARSRGEPVESNRYQFRVVRDDGEVRWLEVNAGTIELGGAPASMGNVQDVTDRKQTEAALAESEERYRSLVEESFDGVFITEEFRVVFANRRFLELLGYAKDELLGMEPALLTHPNWRALVRERAAARLRGEEVISPYEVELLSREGGRIPVELWPRRVVLGGRPAILVWVRDLTEAREAERRRRELEAQLRHAQKMEAVGTLASGVAHDFNNILQAIAGYAQLLKLEVGEAENAKRYAAEVERATARAADLVKGLLTFSSKAEKGAGPVRLGPLVQEAVSLLERAIPKMIAIELDQAPDLPPVGLDPSQVERLVMNLGTNARDAMPDGGTLTIATRLVRLEKDQTATGLRAGDYVELSFADTGQGISEATQAQIFDPFFTTKPRGKGTGLGLSIVYGIVNGAGGQVLCQSRQGEGTTFRLLLPALEHSGTSEAPRPVAPSLTMGGSGQVLLVDDEESVREVAGRALSMAGYAVATAADGESALEVMAQRGEEVDLIILDLSMPGMGGLACLRQLRRRHPDCRVLIATGYLGDSEEAQDARRKANGYLPKPYRLEELLHEVRRVMDT